MNGKEIKEKIKSLKKIYNEEKFDDAYTESESFVLELFREKKYKDIVEADKKLESIPIIDEKNNLSNTKQSNTEKFIRL